MNPAQERALQQLYKGKPLTESLQPDELKELKEAISMDTTLRRTVGFEFELYFPHIVNPDMRHFRPNAYNTVRDIMTSHGLTTDSVYSKGSAMQSWHVVGDGSIHGNLNDFHIHIHPDIQVDLINTELVSPVLTNDTYKTELEKVSKLMHSMLDNGEYQFQFNSSCGQHIHVGANGITEAQRRNVRRTVFLIQHQLAYYILPAHRENTSYARMLQEEDINSSNYDRYKVMADRGTTFEFRLFNMTRKSSSLIRRALLVDAIVHFGVNNNLTGINKLSLIDDVLDRNVWLTNYLLAVRKNMLVNRKRNDRHLIILP